MVETDLKVEQVKVIGPKYWESFCESFLVCQKYLKFKAVKERTIDCANGVGGQVLPHFLDLLKDQLKVTLINSTHP